MKRYEEFCIWEDITKAPEYKLGDEVNREHFCEYLEEDYDGIERLTDVSIPTLTYYPASGRGPHPAVMICPGGAYSILAWNHEGTDTAAWLNANGISAFLLKYRCPDRRTAALCDAIRAMRLIRARAKEFSIDVNKLGVIGFSAGSHLAGRLSNLPEKETYAPIDEIDKQSPTPNFAFIIYPAYYDRAGYTLDPDMHISKKTPQTFIAQSSDDSLSDSAIAYYLALKKAGIKVSLHMFTGGNHGYGFIRREISSYNWKSLAMQWFEDEIMKTKIW